VSRPAPALRSAAALAAMELKLTSRRGENVLVTLVIPVAVLLFFATVGIVPGIAGPAVDFLLPGALALGIIASGLVNLGIATAYERSYGVLKRLGGSPLPRSGLVAAKIASILALEVVQVVLLIAVAVFFLGWRPAAGAAPLVVIVAVLFGTFTFAGLGLLMAGTLRAEATLALANGLFLGSLMLGGIVLPVDHLPEPLAAIARVLPASALADTFRAALTGTGDIIGPIVVLLVWGLAAVGLSVRYFRWE
jgi:ABC-2 type transport system permease protein